MVLTKWIVPEPNPDLKLSIDTIDYKKLDYEDLRWIYSSTMKKYYREFCNLKGFVQYAERIFDLELLRRNSVNSRVNGYLTPKINESVRISSAKPPLHKPSLHKSPSLHKLPSRHKLPPPVEPPPTLSYDRNIVLNTHVADKKEETNVETNVVEEKIAFEHASDDEDEMLLENI